MPKHLARLKGIGFARAGCWSLVNGRLSLELDPQFVAVFNVLYAFAVDGALVYVGKTNKPLRVRLQRYKTPAKSDKSGASTNIKNHKNILECLSRGSSVEIFVLHHEFQLERGGFAVNFAAGLEDSLIAELAPPWNGRQSAGRDVRSRTKLPVVVASRSRALSSERVKSRVTADEFRKALKKLLDEATGSSNGYLEINAGELHRQVGGYPGKNHVMPTCCAVMRSEMKSGDEIIAQPPRGQGASVTIRFRLPRKS